MAFTPLLNDFFGPGIANLPALGFRSGRYLGVHTQVSSQIRQGKWPFLRRLKDGREWASLKYNFGFGAFQRPLNGSRTPEMDSNQSGAVGGIILGVFQGSLTHLGASRRLRGQRYIKARSILGHILTFFDPPCQPGQFFLVQNDLYRCPTYVDSQTPLESKSKSNSGPKNIVKVGGVPCY